MIFGPSSSSGLFAGPSHSGAGLGLIGPSGSSASVGAGNNACAASARLTHDVTALSATATLRGAFVACAGPGCVSILAMKRINASDAAAQQQQQQQQTTGRVGGARGAGQSHPRLLTSAVATQATASPAVASAIAVTPIRGSSTTGRSGAGFDRATVVTGSSCGTVEVFEASTPAGDAVAMPDLRRVAQFALHRLLGVAATDAAVDDFNAANAGAIHAIAGASSAAHGVSWVAIAGRATLVIHEATALFDRQPQPLAVLDGCSGPDGESFGAGFSGAHIVDVTSVLNDAANDGSSAAASGDADSDGEGIAHNVSAVSRGAAAWGTSTIARGAAEGPVKDLAAFSVTWSDGTVQTVRAVLRPIERGQQPVEFYATRSVDPRAVFGDDRPPSVVAAASSTVAARSAHVLPGTAGPYVRTVLVTAANDCCVAVYPPAAGSDRADVDDEDSPAPLNLYVSTNIAPVAVAAVDVEEPASRGSGTAVIAATGTELLVSRWERAAGGPGSLRPLRPVATFDAFVTCMAVLAPSGDRGPTAPSTPASRASAGAASSGVSRNAGSSSGPVAIAAADRSLHFVLV